MFTTSECRNYVLPRLGQKLQELVESGWQWDTEGLLAFACEDLGVEMKMEVGAGMILTPRIAKD